MDCTHFVRHAVLCELSRIMLLSIAMCMHDQLIALALSGMQFCARDYVVVDCSVHEPLTSETVAVQL